MNDCPQCAAPRLENRRGRIVYPLFASRAGAALFTSTMSAPSEVITGCSGSAPVPLPVIFAGEFRRNDVAVVVEDDLRNDEHPLAHAAPRHW